MLRNEVLQERGAVMGVDFTNSHSAMDVRQHEGAYSGFIKLMTIICAVTILTLVGMAVFLT